MIEKPRVARPNDCEEFMQMVREYVLEIRSLGSDILPTERTFEWYESVFDSVTDPESGGEEGVALIAPARGFSLATLSSLPYDSDMGKMALGLGTFVRPQFRQHGLATTLRRMLEVELTERGFDSITGGAHTTNTAAIKSMQSIAAGGWSTQLQFISRLNGGGF